jgi:hypothetical protein
MNLSNLNLPTDLQRVAPLLAVAVLAVVGLFLVTRGLGGEDTTVPPNPAPAKTSPAEPGGDADKGGTANSSPSKSEPSKSEPATKPSKQNYLNCVAQATDSAALEKCQALVP